MDIKIEITKDDIGFSYKKIKSILEKFDVIHKNKDEIESLFVSLPKNKSKDKYNDLSYSLIHALLESCNDLKCKKYLNCDPKSQILSKRHFLDSLIGAKKTKNVRFDIEKAIPINFSTFSAVRSSQNTGTDEKDIEKIFQDSTKNLFDKKNTFHSEIKTQMLEIINNAFDHSKLKEKELVSAVCSLENNIINFCVVDMGQGVKNSFLSNPALKMEYQNKEDHEVILNSTNLYISCNPKNNRNPGYSFTNGGSGLYFLKEFIKHHSDGQMIILSGKGYYSITSNGTEKIKNFISTQWKGTAVFFKIKFHQNRSSAYENLCNKFIDNMDSYNEFIKFE